MNPASCIAPPRAARNRFARGFARAAAVCALAALAAPSQAPAQAPPPPEVMRQSRLVLGTRCEIQVYDYDAERARNALAAALGAMEDVDDILTVELPEMNGKAGQKPFGASEGLYSFIRECSRVRERMAGAFDPALGAIVRAWEAARPGRPTDAVMAAAKAAAGFDKVLLDDKYQTVSYSVAGLEIDPVFIGRAYAVDKAVASLKKSGIKSALVNAGSAVYAFGAPPGQSGWKVLLRDPATRQSFGYVELKNGALSTSSQTDDFQPEGSVRQIQIDPRTGDPARNICQVTALAPTGTEAGAMTQAGFALTRESLAALLKKDSKRHVFRVENSCGAGRELWTTPWSDLQFTVGPNDAKR